MSAQHTPEPWEAVTPCPGECCWHLQSVNNDMGPWGHINNPEMREADARRIVACVNACSGVSTEILEDGARNDWADLLSSMEKQRDKLLAEMKTAVDRLQFHYENPANSHTDIPQKMTAKALRTCKSLIASIEEQP